MAIHRRRFLTISAWGAGLACAPVLAAPVTRKDRTEEKLDSRGGFLPLFPLDTVVFPGQDVTLHIFEPRYKELVRDCEESKTTFGMPPVRRGKIFPYGTELELVQVLKRYPAGEMDVLTRGARVFHVTKFHKEVRDKLYSGGDVAWLENDPSFDAEVQREIVELINRVLELRGADLTFNAPDARNLSFFVGHDIGLSFAAKSRLLTLAKESERQDMVLDHLRETVKDLEERRRSSQEV